MSDPHEKLLEETTRTPVWLPVTGLVLFFFAALYLLLQAGGEPDVTLESPAPTAADGGGAPDAGTAR